MIYNKSITATVYIVKDGKVLLHKHKKYKTWFPVGGHVEPDEFPHQTAIREAKEESGLDIRLISTEQLGDYDTGRVERIPLPLVTYRCGDDEEFYDFIYIGEITGGQLGSGEKSEFKWFSRDELGQDVKVHIRNTALQVLSYLEGK